LVLFVIVWGGQYINCPLFLCPKISKWLLTQKPNIQENISYFLREKDDFEPQHIKNYLHIKEWFRKVSHMKTTSLGEYIHYLPKT
jgi:hypothetical protein